MYSINGSMVWPSHLMTQHRFTDHKDVADVSAYIVIVMMLYAAGIILMMVKYSGSSRIRILDEDEKQSLLQSKGGSSHPFTARLFRTFLSKNGAKHVLDTECDISVGANV